MVVQEGTVLAALGVALGVAGALGLTRLMGGLLFGVTAADPATYIAVTLILACVALVACGVPAFRAAKVDPALTMRAE